MIDKNPNFTPQEYQARIAKTRAAMDAAQLDAIFVTDPSNMARYACGSMPFSLAVSMMVIARVVLSRLRSGLSTHLCGFSFKCQGAFAT
jgi:Xaa-Pro aminopeptidase